jgi:hypothetical protein
MTGHNRLMSALAPWLIAGCIAAPLDDMKSGLPDGAECVHDQDCHSQGCNYNRLCRHSACDCPGKTCTEGGEASPDCASGWLCVYYKSILHGVGEFFGSEGDLNGGTCQPSCKTSACPEHYLCDGEFCKADDYWANPIPSIRWSGDAEGSLNGSTQTQSVPLEKGKHVTLTASAESPVHVAIAKYAWTIVAESGERTAYEGMTVDISLDSGGFRRAELIVSDADARSAQISVSFEACLGAGESCGYQGSGCCNACDADKKFCL